MPAGGGLRMIAGTPDHSGEVFQGGMRDAFSEANCQKVRVLAKLKPVFCVFFALATFSRTVGGCRPVKLLSAELEASVQSCCQLYQRLQESSLMHSRRCPCGVQCAL